MAEITQQKIPGSPFGRAGSLTSAARTASSGAGDSEVVTHPRISIITVVYNGATELEQTIQSVIGQCYRNVEYIVIDGGSTDGTLEILERHRDRIDVLVSEPDRGIYDAMNKGLGLARGDWINFMNCGDYFYDLRVLEHIAPDLSGGRAIVAGGYTMFSDSNSTGFNAEPLAPGKMPSCHQSIFFNAGRAKQAPYDIKFKVGADYDVVCRLAHDDAASIALSSVMVVKMNAVGFASANFRIWLSDYRAVIRRTYGPLVANLWTIKALAAKYCPGLVRLASRRSLTRLLGR